jgi:hypothetical protein
MFRTAFQQGRSKRKAEAYFSLYVEVLSLRERSCKAVVDVLQECAAVEIGEETLQTDGKLLEPLDV